MAEQVCYGKINIMEGLTLLSLSRRDQCVYYWTGYITQTRGHACNVHTFRAKMYIQSANMHTHKEHIKVKYTCSSRDIHTYTQAIHICFAAHHPPCALCFGYVCMYVCVHSHVCVCLCVCVPASESLNALMTTVLTQVF